MQYPVNYIAIAQPFIKGKHYGIDFGWNAKYGGKNVPIYSVADGEVIYKGYQSSGGNVIHIRQNDGFVSEYAHLDKVYVNKGERVKKGQKIALMGGTGNVTGNHLHFGLYKGTSINYNNRNNFVNPLLYLYKTKDQIVGQTTAKNYKILEEPEQPTNPGYNSPTLKIGDRVKIIGYGNANTYGTGRISGGIGWTRQILKIYSDRAYPYQIGNSTGITGYYKEKDLQKL